MRFADIAALKQMFLGTNKNKTLQTCMERRLARFAQRIQARAESPEQVAVLDDSVFVKTALVGSFSSSYWFTFSSPARDAGLDWLRRTPLGRPPAVRYTFPPAPKLERKL